MQSRFDSSQLTDTLFQNENNSNSDDNHATIIKDALFHTLTGGLLTQSAHKNNTSDPETFKTAAKGAWLGIDLGTSNCSCAIWDTNKHKAKVQRLKLNDIATPEKNKQHKAGYLVPSILLFHQDENDDEFNYIEGNKNMSNSIVSKYYNNNEAVTKVLAGHAAVKKIEELSSLSLNNGSDVSKATVGSIKRILGVTSDMIPNLDDQLIQSLPFSTKIEKHQKSNDEAIQAIIYPLSNTATTMNNHVVHHDHFENKKNKTQTKQMPKKKQILISPQNATAILLQNIKHATEKKLKLEVENAVIGVPAHYSQHQRTTVLKAARQAGFKGHLSTLTESTAASLSYGLFVAPNTYHQKHDNDEKNETIILVLDVGGGTSDVTIASLQEIDGEIQFQVKASAGNCRLGGDDVDQYILDFFIDEITKKTKKTLSDSQQLNLDKQSDIIQLRKECRRAKEELCDLIIEQMDTKPMTEINHVIQNQEIKSTIQFKNQNLVLRPQHLQHMLEPFLNKIKSLVQSSLSSIPSSSNDNLNTIVDELILVGGSTNLFPIRTMLQKLFPHIPEFCTSVHPMKAVAHGCAIQCAILSKTVPKYELRNIMMLDVLPHSIGVRINDDTFVPILNKNDQLPARNYQTFQLANLDQKGVTVFAVEDVGDGYPLQPLGEFSFLLHRLSEKEKELLEDGVRTVDIGMTVDKGGKLIVSIFDWNDPEHLMKKKRYVESKKNNSNFDDNPKLIDDMKSIITNEKGSDSEDTEDSFTREQIFLTIACVIIFTMYIAAKIVFSANENVL